MADPVSVQILIGLIVEGLADLARQFRRWEHQDADRRAFIGGQVQTDATITDAIDSAIARLAEVPKVAEAAGGERLRTFLRSPEVAHVVRQLFIATFGRESGDIRELKHQFAASMALWLDLPPSVTGEEADRLFDALTTSVEQALDLAIEDGSLAAHEAKDTARFAALRHQLSNIEHNLSLLSSGNVSLEEILAFESTYRAQVDARESVIVPPDLDRYEKKPIDSLYVAPRFLLPRTNGAERYGTYTHLLARLNRVVLLGDPGGGKSTLALKLCHDLATRYDERPLRDTSLTPILVVLREYGARKKQDSLSLLEFIDEQARTKYQVDDVPVGAFEYLLRNGRALVIFDGLDELLDTSYRREISADVESFANLYSSVPILVTSRKVGYEQAPLSPDDFETLILATFDDAQVRAYAQKWFSLQVEEAPERETKIESFLQESAVVPDLRSNPLMLGLICNIYRGQGYIPANRPDVFEKCAVMLFERWDQRRDIKVSLRFESKLRPAMQFLAHWIYGDPQLRAGVTRDALIGKAASYLHPRQFEDEDEAREAASEFIDVCKGRAWVFTDTGTTAAGQPLFQFTHQTFLEFFTADYLARTHNSPDELFGVLAPRVERREWDVVAQLAVQLQTKYIEDAADDLTRNLLGRARSAGGVEALNLVSFAARALEFLVPSPANVRAITRASVAEILRIGQFDRPAETAEPLFVDEPAEPEVLLVALANCGRETLTPVQRELAERAAEALQERDATRAALAAEAVLCMTTATHRAEGSPWLWDRARDWREFERSFARDHADALREIADANPLVAADLLYLGTVDVDYVVKRFGISRLFRNRPYRLIDHVQTLPPAQLALNSAVHHYPPYLDAEEAWWRDGLLPAIGEILSHADPPWTDESSAQVQAWFAGRSDAEVSAPGTDGWSPNQLFAAFACAAVALEAVSETDREIALDTLKKEPHGILKEWASVLVARFEPSADARVPVAMRNDYGELVTRWAAGDLNFVARDPKLGVDTTADETPQHRRLAS